ncbi:hypothetical protein [Halomonas korlensis]|nr:hypothetical protein [Halomonas korlensis]
MGRTMPSFVESGVWVLPFGKLVYVTSAYVMSEADLAILTKSIMKVLVTSVPEVRTW